MTEWTFFGAGMTSVVQAAVAVEEVLGSTPVIVGGLAVMCRLERAYRATVDLDLVERLHESQVPQLELLRRAPGTNPVEPSAVEVGTDAGMVKVDVIQVNQAEIEKPSDDPGDRLHASSHAWALDTATPIEISSVDRATGTTASISALVATPGALVAMKLQAIRNRSAAKQGTDLLDIVRLVLDRQSQPSILAELASCSSQMRLDIIQHVDLWLRDKGVQSLLWIRSAGGNDVEADDLDLVAELLIEACTIDASST